MDHLSNTDHRRRSTFRQQYSPFTHNNFTIYSLGLHWLDGRRTRPSLYFVWSRQQLHQCHATAVAIMIYQSMAKQFSRLLIRLAVPTNYLSTLYWKQHSLGGGGERWFGPAGRPWRRRLRPATLNILVVNLFSSIAPPGRLLPDGNRPAASITSMRALPIGSGTSLSPNRVRLSGFDANWVISEERRHDDSWNAMNATAAANRTR